MLPRALPRTLLSIILSLPPLLGTSLAADEGPALAALANVSIRGAVSPGLGTLIGGFVIKGDTPKQILLRGRGPSMGPMGVARPLADPFLDLRDLNGAPVDTNDSWSNSLSETMASLGATALQPGNSEAALLALRPAAPLGSPQSALLSGVNDTTGVGQIEIYDAAPKNSKVLNLSGRALVGTGEDVLIIGFVINGPGTLRVLLQGVGPGIKSDQLPTPLANPEITLYDAKGATLGYNDNWDGNDTLVREAATLGATKLTQGSLDAALVAELPEGAYSFHVRGVGGTKGVALGEVYAVQAFPETKAPTVLTSLNDSLQARLEEITGVRPVTLDGTEVRISERSSSTNRARTRALLRRYYESYGYTVTEHNYGGGTNLIAERLGSEDTFVVIGAHYDSVEGSPGADDNGSGTIGMLEAARLLQGKKFRHGLRFVSFDEEEIGLVGSGAYVAKLYSTNEYKRLVGALCIDSITCDTNNDGRFMLADAGGGGVSVNGFLGTAVEQAISRNALPVQIKREPGATSAYGTDMGSFWQRGLPAINIGNSWDDSPMDVNHSPRDRTDRVNWDYMGRMTRVIAHSAAQLAVEQ